MQYHKNMNRLNFQSQNNHNQKCNEFGWKKQKLQIGKPPRSNFVSFCEMNKYIIFQRKKLNLLKPKLNKGALDIECKFKRFIFDEELSRPKFKSNLEIRK